MPVAIPHPDTIQFHIVIAAVLLRNNYVPPVLAVVNCFCLSLTEHVTMMIHSEAVPVKSCGDAVVFSMTVVLCLRPVPIFTCLLYERLARR